MYSNLSSKDMVIVNEIKQNENNEKNAINWNKLKWIELNWIKLNQIKIWKYNLKYDKRKHNITKCSKYYVFFLFQFIVYRINTIKLIKL